MILGLDISTSITGVTVLNDDGKVVFNEAWDFRNKKYSKNCFISLRKNMILLRFMLNNRFNHFDLAFHRQRHCLHYLALTELFHGCLMKYSN